MHRKFFAIGLAISFALSGGFLGWQQLQLEMERRAQEAALEESRKEVSAEVSSEYTTQVSPIPASDTEGELDGSATASRSEGTASRSTGQPQAGNPQPADGVTAKDTVSDRLASLESASQSRPGETEPEQTKTANTIKKRVEFSTVDRSYFTDALFVGDSRMVGIKEYGGLKEPTYFANTGLSTFGLYTKELEVKDIGTIGFEDLITNYKFGKVYIMLGINEAGSKLSDYHDKLDSIVADVIEKQPDATIFLMANLHVTKYKSQTDKTYSNAHIDEINATIDKIAAKYGAYYIDANPLFDDGEGNLSKDCASDYAHLKGRCYPEWIDFICTKGIVYEKEGESAM